VEENSKRLMPYQTLATRTIGLSREYVASNGKTKKQNVGLEKSYDSLLTGQKGQRLVRFIAGGVPGCPLMVTRWSRKMEKILLQHWM
jgi:cell division protein FtsI (penicillin-binding protein 3)